MKKLAVAIAVILTIVTVLSGCSASSGEAIAFGSFYNISVTGISAGKVIKEAKKLITEIENQCSTHVETSDVAKINSAEANAPIHVGIHTASLFKLSKELFLETDGAFNAAIFPLVELWNFSPASFFPEQKSIPSEEDIGVVLPYCSMNLFSFDENSLTITKSHKEAKLDFGGIAKGYAADKVSELLKQKDFIINIGGTIVCGKEKTIGITNPRDVNSLIGTVKLENASISTSGDYERYYVLGGKRYHHILDILTGAPSVGFYSVSVIGGSAAVCDAYSTAVMVKGKDLATRLTEKGFGFVTVGSEGIDTIGEVSFSR